MERSPYTSLRIGCYHSSEIDIEQSLPLNYGSCYLYMRTLLDLKDLCVGLAQCCVWVWWGNMLGIYYGFSAANS